MENNIINNNPINIMNDLIFPSTSLSYYDTLSNVHVSIDEIREDLKKRGLLNNSNENEGLTQKVKTLSLYNKKSSDYVKTNFYNNNVYSNFPILVKNDIEVTKETNSLNIKNENNENENNKKKPLISYLMHYKDIQPEFAKIGIYNLSLPEILINKIIKMTYNFQSELAANQMTLYQFNTTSKYSNQNVYKLLSASLNPTYALISQPHIIESVNRVDIGVLFYSYNLISKNLKKSTTSFLKRNEKRLNYLCQNLSQLFKTYVNLDLTRIYNPSSDSNILANAIGNLSNKTKPRIVRKKLLKLSKIINPNRIVNKEHHYFNSLMETKTINPGLLSGINVRVAGRLLTEKVVPRKTVRSFQIGSLARSKANIVKTDRYTRKNKRGCFSVTVKTGHIVN